MSTFDPLTERVPLFDARDLRFWPENVHDAADNIDLAAGGYPEVAEALWELAFPAGGGNRGVEQAVMLAIDTNTDQVVAINPVAGDGSHVYPDRMRTQENPAFLGPVHTHQRSLAFSGDDMAYLVNHPDQLVIAESGDRQFLAIKTSMSPEQVDGPTYMGLYDRALGYALARTTDRAIAELAANSVISADLKLLLYTARGDSNFQRSEQTISMAHGPWRDPLDPQFPDYYEIFRDSARETVAQLQESPRADYSPPHIRRDVPLLDPRPNPADALTVAFPNGPILYGPAPQLSKVSEPPVITDATPLPAGMASGS